MGNECPDCGEDSCGYECQYQKLDLETLDEELDEIVESLFNDHKEIVPNYERCMPTCHTCGQGGIPWDEYPLLNIIGKQR